MRASWLVVGLMAVAVASGQKKVVEVQPAGPVVVIDTMMGRITCKLYSKQAPVTSANFVGLAEGTKDWVDASTGTTVKGKPFFDGVAIGGVTDGITSGDRLGGNTGLAGPPFPAEKSGLGFERGGRLVMARASVLPDGRSEMTSASRFYVTGHADKEYEARGGTVFGQCDEASIAVVTAISHALLSVDNYPTTPIAINHVSVLKDGEAMPPVAANVPADQVMPQPATVPMESIPAPEPTGPTAVIDVAGGTGGNGEKIQGQLTCKLFKEQAPVGVANFIGLATGTKEWKNPSTHVAMKGKPFYNGLSFARVIPDFMVQQADLPGDASGDGYIGFHFGNEVVPGLTFDRPGRLAYANAGENTNQSEFFVTEHATRRLNGNFTIFGQCDEASMKLVEAIARVPRNAENRPLVPVKILKVVILP